MLWLAVLCNQPQLLLWVGACCFMCFRFTGALTSFDQVTACIAAELLPARAPSSIKKRFTNLVGESAGSAAAALHAAALHFRSLVQDSWFRINLWFM